MTATRTATVGDTVIIEECFYKHRSPWLPIYHAGHQGTVIAIPGPERYRVQTPGFTCLATKITRLEGRCVA